MDYDIVNNNQAYSVDCENNYCVHVSDNSDEFLERVSGEGSSENGFTIGAIATTFDHFDWPIEVDAHCKCSHLHHLVMVCQSNRS